MILYATWGEAQASEALPVLLDRLSGLDEETTRYAAKPVAELDDCAGLLRAARFRHPIQADSSNVEVTRRKLRPNRAHAYFWY